MTVLMLTERVSPSSVQLGADGLYPEWLVNHRPIKTVKSRIIECVEVGRAS